MRHSVGIVIHRSGLFVGLQGSFVGMSIGSTSRCAETLLINT